MWMNEDEIDRALAITREHAPQFAPYAQFLSDWRDTVNSNSDGWPFWKAGANCAEKLQTAISKIVEHVVLSGSFPRPELPTEEELKKSLAPIRALATRHKLTVPELQQVAPESPSPPR